jgi:peptidoglycan/LPS O-acetylase OafA/YrhL
LNIIKNQNRIPIVDGFRSLAIISVILYHYFYRWNDSVYPYFGSDLFHQGFKGVSFFFIISGFVIFYTLENTTNFVLFWKKRFVRLFPSMLIASILTFVFLRLFDFKNIFEDSNHFRNLIISFTFLPPNLFDWVLGTKNNFSYLNFSYWSLWPEIQFYVLSSVIFFLNKDNFRRNFIIFCFTMLFFYDLIFFLNLNQIKFIERFLNLFNLIIYLIFFLSGGLFYIIYSNKKSAKLYIGLLFILFIMLNFSMIKINLISSSIMFLLFFCFIYYPRVLRFLESNIFINIGTSSYFLYLIHEYIGVVWIRNIVPFFYPYSFIAPVLILLLIVGFSIFYSKQVESKIIFCLNKILFK